MVDPADLTLPEVIPTNKQGIVLKKAPGDQRVEIDIVGPIEALAEALAALRTAGQ